MALRLSLTIGDFHWYLCTWDVDQAKQADLGAVITHESRDDRREMHHHCWDVC